MGTTKYWIALEQSQGIGPAHLKEIHSELQNLNLSVSDLFDLTDDEIAHEFSFGKKIIEAIIGAKGLVPEIENDYFALLDAGIEVIPFFSEQYPSRLFETMGNSFPPILYGFGNRAIGKKHGIALLGDKDVSEKGEMIAYLGAKELARHDVVTLSGFASGVGAVAHRSALENSGETLAIVPYGIFHFKIPPFLQEVMDPERICILSPFYPTKEVNKFNAYIRNKIICALAHGVYIVEAPKEGGIFEAAKSAHKLKVPLFTTRYEEYPENAQGNPRILEELGGKAVQRRKDTETMTPNMDPLIGLAKFS